MSEFFSVILSMIEIDIENSEIQNDIAAAVETLKQGGVILYPTDTVWGIGCDATNAEAVQKIYDIKRRAEAKSMLALVDSEEMLQKWVRNVPDTAWEFIDIYTTPLTIIYDKPKRVAKNLTAEDGSLGIRITSDPFCQELCRRLKRPLVSTSANISGTPTARHFRDISPEILNAVDYVVKHRQDDLSDALPSDIIKISDSETVKFIR